MNKLTKLFTVLLLVALSLFFLKEIVFDEESDAGISVFEIDRENQLILTPYYDMYSDELTMGEIILASEYSDTQLIENTTFATDTTVYFIMANITGVSVQEDGYSWYDVDLYVMYEDGTIMIEQSKNLGETGKMVLKSDLISPYGIINVPSDASSGEYTIFIKVYDVYTNEFVERDATFTIS